MAEPLKTYFGPDKPSQIAAMIAAVSPEFKKAAFLKEVLAGYDELELTPRGWHIARTLRRFLPENYSEATQILIESLGSERPTSEGEGMDGFLYMPHSFFVAEFGLDDFENSMIAIYEITKRFTSEFSIRPFLIHHQERTLKQLAEWVRDDNVHVRRLVSEGTRPRLPWAPRIKAFQEDPTPVLRLLDRLKDDPELYVRRSVANNLNDIGKDHPDMLIETARKWSKGADEARSRLIRHALRSLVKSGNAAALEILGYGPAKQLRVNDISITPAARIGETVSIAFSLTNHDKRAQHVMVDIRIHYVKSNGSTSPKVFKMKAAYLEPDATLRLRKRISVAQMTTRTHYPGEHRVEAILNGSTQAIGKFDLRP
jgi:3-methyladenine DNA glycosylase AlkC